MALSINSTNDDHSKTRPASTACSRRRSFRRRTSLRRMSQERRYQMSTRRKRSSQKVEARTRSSTGTSRITLAERHKLMMDLVEAKTLQWTE